MFQTDLHRWLQEFSTPWLDQIWLFISSLGLQMQTQAILIVVVFAVSYRKGFLLLQLVLWNTLLTEWLKELFAYPRPFMVDSGVRGIEIGEPGTGNSRGATSFFGLLDNDTLTQARSAPGYHNWGIPSGHTSGVVALWGGMMSLFRSRLVWAIGLALIVLIPFSRLYLGMHFLADVIAGYLLGALVLWAFIHFVFSRTAITQILFSGKPQAWQSTPSLVYLALTFVAPILIWILGAPYSRVALIVGIQFGCYLVWLRGLPLDDGNWQERTKRTLTALVWTVLVIGIGETIDDATFVKANVWLDFLINVTMYAVLIFGATEINVKLKWLHRTAP